MACIYTGAVVGFTEYGVVHLTDLHQVGDTVVFNLKPGTKFFQSSCDRDVTHLVKIGDGFMNQERGFFATKAANVVQR